MPGYFLGIDVSKGYADFVLLDQQKRVVEPVFQLDDTIEGHNRLYGLLHRFWQRHDQAQFFAGLEATGGYENNWLEALRRFQARLPLQVARLHSFSVHAPVRSPSASSGSRGP